MKKHGMLCALLLVAIILFGTTGAVFSSELLLERAKNLYSVQDYRAALSLFEKLLEEAPEDGEVLDYSAWCLRYIGDWKSAEERFQQALDAPSGALISWLHVGLGETYLGAGDEAKSAEAFQKAMEAAPEDEELVLRSLKGIVWAKAFRGDREEYEKTLSLLKAKDVPLAGAVAADTASILEEREKIHAEKESVAEESTEPILVLDTLERQAKLLEDKELELEDELEEVLAEVQVKEEPTGPDAEVAVVKEDEELEIVVLEQEEDGVSSASHEESPTSDVFAQSDVTATGADEEPKDVISATPALEESPAAKEVPAATPTPEKPVKKPAKKKPASKPVQSEAVAPADRTISEIQGVRLGAPLEEELARLETNGFTLDRENTVDKNGVLRFVFVPKTSFFPVNILADAASVFYHIEGYSEFVLKVQGMLKTKPQASPLEWKKNAFEAMITEFSSQYGKPAIFSDQGTSSEAAWFIPDKRVLWVFADAGLDNTCSIQISYVDRRIQAGHLINVLK